MTPPTRQTHEMRPKTTSHDKGKIMKELKVLQKVFLEAYREPENLKTLDQVKQFWKDEKNNLKDQHTFRSRLNLMLKKERTYVPHEVHLSGKSVTDNIDPEFFTTIYGRPIKQKHNTSEYLRDIRTCFLTKLKIGFNKDEILLMNECYMNEKKLLSELRERFVSVLRAFEDFLMEDHACSRVLLKTVREEVEMSHSKLTTLNGLQKILKEVETDILVVMEEWRKSKLFQKFLYLTAPAEWRKINDPEYEQIASAESVTDPCQFDRESPEESNVNLEIKVQRFLDDISGFRPPVLYFSHPQQIVDILSALEKNNLRALMNCVDLDFPAANAIAVVEKLKKSFEEDQARLVEDVGYLNDLVKEEEDKAAKSEQKYREIVFGLFRNLVVNEEYLSVMAYLEDAYEEVVASTDHNPDMLTMMKEIELEYERVALALDNLPNDMAVVRTKRFYREQRREIAEAKNAERKVHQMEMLLKRLKKALSGPPKGRKERKMVARSQPPEEELNRKKQPKILTKEEKERMFLFGRATETAEQVRPLCV
ncbi:hypothetical protein RUM43_013431 [Polyplax serrata]|uniref:Uncharacterized protein n=1 Tax=Polyplax serrata TaxID=468196 RepID=A0AAN8P5G8_POLSC